MEREAVILVGKDVAHNVALQILDSIDPKVYRDMVSRYPDIDPDHFIAGAPVNANKLLERYAWRHENSKEVLEVAAEHLADTVYSIIGEENKMEREAARTQFEDVLGVIREQLDIVEAICNDQLNCPVKIEVVTHKEKPEVHGETWTEPITLLIHLKAED